MKRLATLAFFAVFAAAPSMAQVSTSPAEAPAGTYHMESAHSQVLFSIVHAGLTDYYGRFDKVSGTLNFNPGQPEKSATSISIDMSTIDTPSAELTDELEGPNVFNAAQFPVATFKSTSIARTGHTTGKITGDLTIRGVTKSVTLDVTFAGGEQNPLGNSYSLGFKATAAIKRTDFGLTGMRWESFVGDNVNIIIEAMFDSEKH